MKRVFIDMDNVLVDFQSGLDQVSEEVKAEYAGRLDEIPGLFAKMKPVEGAIEAVHELQKHYDLFILSTAPWKNPSAWSDKVEWVTKYLDDVFHKKMIITHRKDLCQGDYLIDDRGKNGTSEFSGEWIHFGSEQFPDWESVLKFLASERLDEYLQEIGRTHLLTPEEELALSKAIQEKGPDCEEKEQLVKANLRFVVAVANQYHSRFVVAVANQYQKRGLTLEELIEVGNEGLVKAAEKYVPNAESKFISYAVWWIRQSIIQAIEENKKQKSYNMDPKLEILSQMLDRHYRRYTETFIDEETGKEEVIEHEEIINGDLSGEERQLIEMIAADVPNLSNEDLFGFQKLLINFKYRAFDEIYLEMVRRGEEEEASRIESPAILQELCDKGKKYAAYELYHKCMWGDEKNGIFINRKRAREYYDLAGEIPLKEDWDDSDDPGEPNPSTYEYVLTGNAATLDGVETLIRDLCKRFGIPENEEDGLGLYVPQRQLMKVLVGSDTEYYRGNIQYLEREAPDRLVITTEADKGEPLLYALRCCFENLTVEMQRN